MPTSKLTIEKNTEAQVNAVNIKTLSDRPNVVSRYGEGGLSATQLKERFDGFPALNREKINQIIDALNGAESTKYLGIGTEALSEFGVDNLYDLLMKMTTSDIADVLKVDYMKAEDAQAVAYTLQAVISDIMQVNINQHTAITGNTGRIESVESTVSEHAARIAVIEGDNTTQQSYIDNLWNYHEIDHGRIDVLVSDNTTNKEDIKALEGAAAEMLLWKLGSDIAFTQASKEIKDNSGKISTLETAYEALAGTDAAINADIETIDGKLTAALDEAKKISDTVDEHIEAANTTIAGIEEKVDGVFQDGTIKSDSIIIGEGVVSGNSVAGGTIDTNLIKSILGSGYAELINKYGSSVDSIPDSIINAILSAAGVDYTVAEFRQMIKVSPSNAGGITSISYGTSNNSLTPTSMSLGYNNMSGAKGYRVFNIAPEGSGTPAEIRISVGDIPKRTANYVEPNPDILGEWQPDDRLYVAAGGKIFTTKFIKWRVENNDAGLAKGYRLQVERDVSDITVESAPSVTLDKTYYLSDPNDNFVINLDRPTAGEVELGWGAIAIGALNTALGNSALAIGYKNYILGAFGIAFGQENEAGEMAFAGGVKSKATGKGAFAFGNECKATNEYAVALGGDCEAGGVRSFAAGNECKAAKDYAVALGDGNTAGGKRSLATGTNTEAAASGSVSEGTNTRALHGNSHAAGIGTKTGRDNQFVVGQYNKVSSKALFVVGDGSSDTNRTNIFECNDDGTAWLNGKQILTQTAWYTVYDDGNGYITFNPTVASDYEFFARFSITADGPIYKIMLGNLRFNPSDPANIIIGNFTPPIEGYNFYLKYETETKHLKIVHSSSAGTGTLSSFNLYYRLIHE